MFCVLGILELMGISMKYPTCLSTFNFPTLCTYRSYLLMFDLWSSSLGNNGWLYGLCFRMVKKKGLKISVCGARTFQCKRLLVKLFICLMKMVHCYGNFRVPTPLNPLSPQQRLGPYMALFIRPWEGCP